GFLLAIWSSPLLLRLKPAMLSFITLDLQPDWRIIGFTLFASLLTGFVFGLAPALRSSKVDVVSRLKGEAHGGFAKRSLRGALVVIQVAVCLVLLTSAGLCLRSLLNAQSIDPGFQIDNRLAVSLNVQILGYSEDRGRTFYQQLLDRVRAVPGVLSASLANYLPLGFTRLGVTVAVSKSFEWSGQENTTVSARLRNPSCTGLSLSFTATGRPSLCEPRPILAPCWLRLSARFTSSIPISR